MRAYTLRPGSGSSGLEQVDLPRRKLGSHDVRVAVRAAALNFRDIQVARGSYDHAKERGVVPMSDAVGEVVEIGPSVDRFAVGERVLTTFFPLWTDGPISARKTAVTYGAGTDGVLAEELVVSQEALVRAPGALSDAEAATLPCAGVTAWNALFVRGTCRPGATVLILGTGGVAIWALQLAAASGLDPIVTSSSDEKLAVARSMGAGATVNYSLSPEWQNEVLRITGGEGVDLVLEVGGETTLPRSIAATAAGGTIVVVGGLSGFGGARIEPHSLIFGAKTLAAVSVGSRSMLEALVRFVDRTGLKPIVAREFGFDQAAAAYDHLQAGLAVGKVVIRLP